MARVTSFHMCLTSLVFCLAQPALAQSAPTATNGAAADGSIAEIVVTAQKREEPMQEVPVSISAFAAETLASRGVSAVTDLGMVTPGLSFPSTGIGSTPRIRGVGTQVVVAGNENSVSMYVDGVYYPSAGSAVMEFNNIDQVAVLKGPQGTLFGRNATGGLIQITTRDPSGDLKGNVEVGYGNLNTYSAKGYVGGSLGENVAADLAITYKNQEDGFGINLFNGEKVGSNKSFAVRSKWKVEMGDATTATLILDYSTNRGSDPAYRPAPGETTLLGVPFVGGKFDVNSDVQPLSDNEDYGASLNISHEFSGVKLISISAYRHGNWKFAFDSDGSPAPIVSANGVVPDRVFSQELQLISDNTGPLKWNVGVYYFNRKSGFIPAQLQAPALGFIEDFSTRQNTESFAGYGQLSYAIDDATSITTGLRETVETKSFGADGTLHLLTAEFDIPLGPTNNSQKVTKLTWRAAIDHHLSRDIMIYASYNRGFKSGGYDPTSVAVASYIRPEVLDAFEAGIKSDLMDKKIRVNASGYYYDFKDIQLNTYINGLPGVYNGKSAKLYGFDLDVTAIPVSGLTLTAGLSYIHDRFGDFSVATTGLLPGGGITQLADGSARGKRLPNTPDWNINLGFEYKLSIGETNLSIAADYSHSSKWFSDPENRLSQPAYSLVNASTTMYFAQDRYSLKVWAKNIGNKAYAAQLFPQVPIADVIAYAPGRTFGVALAAKF